MNQPYYDNIDKRIKELEETECHIVEEFNDNKLMKNVFMFAACLVIIVPPVYLLVR